MGGDDNASMPCPLRTLPMTSVCTHSLHAACCCCCCCCCCRPCPADRFHCYFADPTVNWTNYVSVVDGVRTFDCPTHRKIRCACVLAWEGRRGIACRLMPRSECSEALAAGESALVNACKYWSACLLLRRYYRAYGDTQDSNGHGTHVVGTLVGLPYGHTLANENSGGYVGMAPDAKVAFIGGCAAGRLGGWLGRL